MVIWLTRHGRTFINEVIEYVPPNDERMINALAKCTFDRQFVLDHIPEEHREEFLRRTGLSLDSDFYVGDTLTSRGAEEAMLLGMYLADREITTFVVPSHHAVPIFRNAQTAYEIKEGFLSKGISRRILLSFSEKLGKVYTRDSPEIPEIIPVIANGDNTLLILNSGLLEGILDHCGYHVDSFDNCGLVGIENRGGRLVVAKEYLSSEQIKMSLFGARF